MADAGDRRRRRRRTFGPVLLVGVASGILLAMSGAERWVSVDGSDSDVLVGITYSQAWDAGVVTSANALALAGLACWGVLLVTRGRFRRVISVVGLLTGIAQVYTVVYSYVTLTDDVEAAFDQLPGGVTTPDLGWTGWFWIGAVAAVLGLLAWVAAVRLVKDWPEMGRRYDTPSDSPPEDLWKAMDQGHDPTS